MVAFIRLGLNLSVAAERADRLEVPVVWVEARLCRHRFTGESFFFFFPSLLITSPLLNLSVVDTDCKALGEGEMKVTVFGFTNKDEKEKGGQRFTVSIGS